MNATDIPFPIVEDRAMCIMIQRVDTGQWWDFLAAAYTPPAVAFDVRRFTLAMTKDRTFPSRQFAPVPAGAAAAQFAVLTVAVSSTTGLPRPDTSYWLGLVSEPESVPLSSALGARIRFTQ